jgi:hypothetical protein
MPNRFPYLNTSIPPLESWLTLTVPPTIDKKSKKRGAKRFYNYFDDFCWLVNMERPKTPMTLKTGESYF